MTLLVCTKSYRVFHSFDLSIEQSFVKADKGGVERNTVIIDPPPELLCTSSPPPQGPANPANRFGSRDPHLC